MSVPKFKCSACNLEHSQGMQVIGGALLCSFCRADKLPKAPVKASHGVADSGMTCAQCDRLGVVMMELSGGWYLCSSCYKGKGR